MEFTNIDFDSYINITKPKRLIIPEKIDDIDKNLKKKYKTYKDLKENYDPLLGRYEIINFSYVEHGSDGERYCDECDKKVCEVGDEYYFVSGLDICLSCASIFDKKEKRLCDYGSEDVNEQILKDCKFDHYGFGSIHDYIPVLEDEHFNLVLLNCNPDSKQYNKVALLSTDNHGRCGIFLSKYPLDDILKKVIQKEKHDGEYNILQGWEKAYRCPIKIIMLDENMPIHYG